MIGEHALRVARFSAADAVVKGRDPIRAALDAVSDSSLTAKLEATIRGLEQQLKAKCPTCARSLPLHELDLSVRALNCVEGEEINTIGDLCAWSPDRLLTLRNFGRSTVKEVEKKLSRFGLALASNEASP